MPQLSKMEKISNIRMKPLGNSIYMKPLTMLFNQNGTERSWDLLKIHDSASIVIFNITRDRLVFVKQFRPAVYYASIPKEDLGETIDPEKYPAKLGITTELCAGIIDKNKSIEEIAAEEVLEECGYQVDPSKLQKIGTCQAVGTSASITNIFYCEVTDDMKVSTGGGVDDEIIEVVEMSIPDMKKYIQQDMIKSPASFLAGMYWFLLNKHKEC